LIDKLILQNVNATYDQIKCDKGIAAELKEYFTFKVPGYQFHPLYKQKVWSGDINLFTIKNNQLYAGLRHHVESFCRERDYELEYGFDNSSFEYSLVEMKQFIATLKLPVEPYDFQISTVTKCIRDGRRLVLSPTSSGKSLMIYILMRYYGLKTLIVAPTVPLVHQMAGDFKDYGFDSDKHCHKIYQGQEQETKKPVTISTWQSIYKNDAEYFEQFDVIMVDEVHLATAKCLKGIMEKCTDTFIRFGWTGTLDDTQTHKLVLEGLFGPVLKEKSTADLIEDGVVSPLHIKMILLKYPEITAKLLNKSTYEDEIDFLMANAARQRFIKNLAESLTGNTLILFRYIDKQGKPLYDDIKRSVKNRNVYYVDGSVSADDRNDLRAIIEREEDSITVGSYGSISTGTNIRRIHNIILASPYKGQIKILQSIGRGLRLHETKTHLTVYDIGDDLQYKNHKNHTLKHFIIRLKIYLKENFDPKIYKVTTKG